MLVLSRHKNEDIVINHDITIKVIEIRGDKVRIGIDAPLHIRVDRLEVHQARQRSFANQGGEPCPSTEPATSR